MWDVNSNKIATVNAEERQAAQRRQLRQLSIAGQSQAPQRKAAQP